MYRLASVFFVIVYLFCTAGHAPSILYYWYDAGLYVSRAYELLMGNGLGPYSDATFMKLPGVSFFLAALRSVGLPYILSVKILFLGSVFYLVAVARVYGLRSGLRLVLLAALMFQPFAFSALAISVVRETIEVPLLLFVLGSSLLLLYKSNKETLFPLSHFLVFSVSIALIANLREEGIVILSFPFILSLFFWQYLKGNAKAWRIIPVLIACPMLLTLTLQSATRSYMESRYGVGILSELKEGSFPRLAASLRSIKKPKENRYIQFSMESLRKAAVVAPELKLVLKEMDRFQVPGKQSQSCTLLGLCGELAATEGFEIIRSAAYRAGLTPTLKEAQAFFERVSGQIDRACESGQLECERQGSGLMPPADPKWTRIYVTNWSQNFLHSFQLRSSFFESPPPLYPVDPRAMRIWQSVTMTHQADTLAAKEHFVSRKWKNHSPALLRNLRLWVDDPKAAELKTISVPKKAVPQKFLALDDPSRETQILRPKTPQVLRSMQDYYQLFYYLMLFGVLLILPSGVKLQAKSSPAIATLFSVFIFVLLRLSALSYVNIFLIVQSRLFHGVQIMMLNGFIFVSVLCVHRLSQFDYSFLKLRGIYERQFSETS